MITKENEKGFTLIELLAVIIILAVIALIATPLIMNVINDSKIGANKDSTYGYIKAATYSLSKTNNDLQKGKSYTINSEGNLVKDGTEYEVEVKGKRPTGGAITFNSDGKMGAALLIDNYCYIKYLTKDDVVVINDTTNCNAKISSNLIINGYGELGNNSNFQQLEYKNKEFLTLYGLKHPFHSDELIPVDVSKKYRQTATLKTTNSSTQNLFGFAEYDIDKKEINSSFVIFSSGTLTKLTKDLNNGDTIVYLDDISKFRNQESTPDHQRGFIFWNYQDSTGYLYPVESYSRNMWIDLYNYNSINKSNNTITLKEPWNKGTIKSGTPLSQSRSGSARNYGLSSTTDLTTTYQTRTNVITQVFKNDGAIYFDSFKPGTKYIKIFGYSNYYGNYESNMIIKNMSFEEID